MLLRSPIARTLLEKDVELVICSPNAQESYFTDEFTHPNITLEPMPQRFSRLEQRLMLIRQYVLMNPSLGATLNYKREQLRRRSPARYRVSRAMNLLLGRIPLLRKAYMAAEARIFPGREFDDLLERHQPDLVVTGTPGYNANDTHLLRASKRKSLPTATVMLSWDNLTSKGYMNGMPDHLLVWSDLMADEAVDYHDYPRERIHWCGAAQFDHYFNYRTQFDRCAWRREHDVPVDAAMIVHGTINPAICPHEINIVRALADVVTSNRLSRPGLLWVRVHPQAVRGAFSQSLQPYLDLAGPNVRIEIPPVRSEALSWDLPQEDAAHLANLVTAADVLCTTSSTLSIDAACVDTPIVNVFFDGEDPVDPTLAVERFMHYTHYAKILDTGGIAKAMDIDQFVSMANAYLADPSHDREGRRRILQQQFNQFDGQAGRRTAHALMQLASGKRPDAANLSPI
jgi:hypothetical protein